jgi:hypothetical protein
MYCLDEEVYGQKYVNNAFGIVFKLYINLELIISFYMQKTIRDKQKKQNSNSILFLLNFANKIPDYWKTQLIYTTLVSERQIPIITPQVI